MHKILLFVSCVVFNNAVGFCSAMGFGGESRRDFEAGWLTLSDRVKMEELAVERERNRNLFEKKFKEFVEQYRKQETNEHGKDELNKKLLEVAGSTLVESEVQFNMIKTLLELGASAAYVSEVESLFDDKTSLCKIVKNHCYFGENRIKSVRALIAAGALVRPYALRIPVVDGTMARGKRLEVIKALVAAKADVNAEDSSALHSLGCQHIEEDDACAVFKIFFTAEHKPDFENVHSRHWNRVALRDAVYWNRLHAGGFFVAAGADYSDVQEPKRSELLSQAKEKSRELMNINIVRHNIDVAGAELW